MKIQLGSTRVTAKSDGGLSLYLKKGTSCSYPIFCLDVTHALSLDTDNKAKRKKHRLRNSETTHQMHAAQIYAEMLGQVCHQKLYNGNLNGYQEVESVINFTDRRHSSFMQDMQRSIYSTPSFPTRIYGTSLDMVLNTNPI